MAFSNPMPSFIGRWNAFRPGDQSHTAGALVDDCGLHGFLQIALARRFAAGIDQARAAHKAIDDLIAREIDRMIGDVRSE